jgi:hypothetical protein
MDVWKPEYICILDSGCVHSSAGHSLSCQKKNVEYAEAARRQEKARRLARMDAVIEDRSEDTEQQ